MNISISSMAMAARVLIILLRKAAELDLSEVYYDKYSMIIMTWYMCIYMTSVIHTTTNKKQCMQLQGTVQLYIHYIVIMFNFIVAIVHVQHYIIIKSYSEVTQSS